jgi:hypothetical protein
MVGSWPNVLPTSNNGMSLRKASYWRIAFVANWFPNRSMILFLCRNLLFGPGLAIAYFAIHQHERRDERELLFAGGTFPNGNRNRMALKPSEVRSPQRAAEVLPLISAPCTPTAQHVSRNSGSLRSIFPKIMSLV